MKLFSPFLCAVASVLAGVACVWTMVFYVSGISWVFQTPFLALPFLFVFVGVVLAPCAWWVLRLEQTLRPALSDHLRHCALLYATLSLLGVSWAKFFYSGGVAIAPVEFAVFFHTGLAILTNALVLLYRRRRFEPAIEWGTE